MKCRTNDEKVRLRQNMPQITRQWWWSIFYLQQNSGFEPRTNQKTAMYRQNEKQRETEIVNTEPRDTTLSKLLGVYILVCAVISGSWAVGYFQHSFLWVFLLICSLFILWKTKLTNIVQNRLYQEEIRIHRKRALRQSETAEWLNFIINRW